MKASGSYLANKFQNFLITCLESVLLVFIGTGCIQAQSVTYSGNLQFATGSYFFTERTESIYFTNGLNLSGDYLRVSLSIPYVIQSTPWISYSAGGGIPTGGPGHGRVDFGGGLSLFHRLRTVFLFTDVMYWQMGNMEGLDLRNPFSVSAGTGKAFRDGKWMVTASYLGSTKMIDDFEPPMS